MLQMDSKRFLTAAVLLVFAGVVSRCAGVGTKTKPPDHLTPAAIPATIPVDSGFNGKTVAFMPTFGISRSEYTMGLAKSRLGQDSLFRDDSAHWQGRTIGLANMILWHSRFYGFWLGYSFEFAGDLVASQIHPATGVASRGGGGYFSHVQMLGYQLWMFRFYGAFGPKAGILPTFDLTHPEDGYSFRFISSFYLGAIAQGGIFFRYRALLLHAAYVRMVWNASRDHIFSDQVFLGASYVLF